LQQQKQWLQMANHVTGSGDPYTHSASNFWRWCIITQCRHNTHHVLISFWRW
jgi:hypothetical protein